MHVSQPYPARSPVCLLRTAMPSPWQPQVFLPAEGALKFQFFSEQYSYFPILSPRYNPIANYPLQNSFTAMLLYCMKILHGNVKDWSRMCQCTAGNKSTPVSRILAIFSFVIFPEHSVCARPAISSTASFIISGVILSSIMISAPASCNSSTLLL